MLILNPLFLEYGHVAYKIKGNEAYYCMPTKILLSHTPLVVSKGQFSLKVGMLHMKLKSTTQKLVFDHTNIYILRICVPLFLVL